MSDLVSIGNKLDKALKDLEAELRSESHMKQRESRIHELSAKSVSLQAEIEDAKKFIESAKVKANEIVEQGLMNKAAIEAEIKELKQQALNDRQDALADRNKAAQAVSDANRFRDEAAKSLEEINRKKAVLASL